MDLFPRHVTYLICSVLLVAMATQTSDIATIRHRELDGGRGFEDPALAWTLYRVERAVAPTPAGIAVVNAAVGVAAVAVVTVLLRREGAGAAVWLGAPTLIVAGVNVDAVTALLILLALRSWRQGNVAAAGVWIGLGTAFKLAPFVLLFPLLGASDRRGAARLLAAAAVACVAANLPLAFADAAAWRFPYEFASQRHDGGGSIWAALGLGVRATNLASAVAMCVLGTAIGLAVRYRELRSEAGAALALLALLVTSKIWQPHYLLWALPVLALVAAPARPIRVLEVANLAYFLVLWRQLPPETEGLWLWPVSAARIAALGWVAVGVARVGRADPGPPPAGTGPADAGMVHGSSS